MYINKYNPTYGGDQPIRVLEHNIIHSLENTNPDFIKYSMDLRGNYNFSSDILYHISNLPVNGHTAFVGIEDNTIKIHLYETFASYVWGICYSLFVIHEETILSEINGSDSIKLQRAYDLFNYSLSLVESYSDWNKLTLPNPEYYMKVEEDYILKTNSLFCNAIRFVLCHEISHIENEDFNRYTPIKSKIIEEEADYTAMEMISLNATEDKNDRAYGSTIGVISMIFLSKEIYSNTHPDIDKRISNIIEYYSPDDNNHKLWLLACMAITLWNGKYNLGHMIETGSTYKEAFFNTFQGIRNK